VTKVAVLLHGDKDRGDLYWCGYDRTAKDHIFDRDVSKAIGFASADDALRAGLGLSKGTHVRIVERRTEC
jgi:hypothetical protein